MTFSTLQKYSTLLKTDYSSTAKSAALFQPNKTRSSVVEGREAAISCKGTQNVVTSVGYWFQVVIDLKTFQSIKFYGHI